MKRIYLLILVLCLFSMGYVFGVEAAPAFTDEAVRLDSLIAVSITENQRLQTVYHEWKSAEKRINAEKSLPDPVFSYRTFVEEVETRVGPQRNAYGLSQRIPFPGKLKTKGQIASFKAKQEYEKYRKERLKLEYQVKHAFYEYWYVHKSMAVVKEDESLLNRLEKVVQEKYRGGQKSNEDLLQVQMRLGKTANKLLSLSDYLDPLKARINTLLNRPANVSLAEPSDFDFAFSQLPEFEEMKNALLSNNPDLELLLKTIQDAKKKEKFAKLGFLPDFLLGVDYIQIDKGPLDVSDNGKDAVSLTVKVDIPFWFGKQKSRLEAAVAGKKSAVSSRVQKQRELEAELQSLIFNMHDAEREVRLYRDALIPKAEQSLDSTEVSYRSGEKDFLSLIEIERQLQDFRLSYYKAIKEYEQARAGLEMVLACPLEKIREEKYEQESA